MTGLEKAMALDRAYFKAHPEAKWYVRDYIPGEGPPVGPGTKILVQQVFPGYRIRATVSLQQVEEWERMHSRRE